MIFSHFVRIFITLTFSVALFSCTIFSNKKEESSEGIIKKKDYNPNTSERAGEIRDSGGGIINFGGGKNKDFIETQNVLWKAALDALGDIPLESASYAGGLINTSWYSPSSSNESIKITALIQSAKLSSASLKVTSFKRTCDTMGSNCKVAKLDDDFNNKIKDSILQKARQLEIIRKTNK
jgi:hypothetical protein